MVDATKPATPDDAAAVVKALESAGWVHPDAPAGFSTPGHALAASETQVEVDHLAEIATLAALAKTSTPAGVEQIADQITAHVVALQAGS